MHRYFFAVSRIQVTVSPSMVSPSFSVSMLKPVAQSSGSNTISSGPFWASPAIHSSADL